ncbi:MAG: DUF2281 domain-containing protein [bacterium]|nr:DUF2281 domain-containing protein [bacterium]
MSTAVKHLAELVQELPPYMQAEVADFAEFLWVKNKQKTDRRLRQDWAGALREFRDRYTAPELQRKTLEWRSD